MFYRIFMVLMLFLLPSAVAEAGTTDLAKTLESYVEANYPWEKVTVNIVKKDGVLSGGAIKEISVINPPPGRTKFLLHYKQDKTAKVTATVKALCSVVVAKKAFRKGHRLEEADVYTVLKDVRFVPSGAFRESRDVVGKRLVQSVPSNALLKDKYFYDPSLVKRGHNVDIVIQAPGFTIKAVGRTLEHARVGQIVKVVMSDTNKRVSGFLADTNTVEVQY